MGTFQEQLRIDHNSLDLEWLNQPKLFMEVSEEAANSRRDMEAAKLKLEIVEAEVYQAIRSDPEAHGLAKGTEKEVDCAVKQSKGYREARQAFIDATHSYEVLSSAVRAFDQRKKALEMLVTLHGQQYFSGPKEPRNLDTEWLREQEKRTARARVTKKARATE